MADRSEPWRKTSQTSWVPRILAPLALVAVVIAVFVIVNTYDDSGSGSSGSETAATSSKKGKIPKTYIVQPGDSLTSISEQFDISIDRIERLNPDIDAQTLNEGDELKLH
jgi:LysM repeat protein